MAENFRQERHRCHACGNMMQPATSVMSFHRQDPVSKVITTKSIVVDHFVCPECGEIIYASHEAKHIETILMDAV